MLLRVVKTIGFLLLLPLGYALTLLPLLLVWPHVQFQYLVPALIAWAALYLLPFPFFLRFILRRVWFFKGRGEPVLQDLLEFTLLAVNDFNNPVQVRKKKNKLRLCWRSHDADWCQRMFLAGMKRSYELHLEFSPETRTVIMRDKVRHIDLSRCPVKVRLGLMSSTRFYIRMRTAPQWRLTFLEQTAPADYLFHPQEIKSPVFNTILENGWNIRFDL
ncbi:MAG: hypothetical protein SD837_13240 [Candidatus Electrothrix scaldis]|nr:MAG: hypothetical protein SD837_13240 [Candidatus Electrothrix sp. GW3-3]